jgi:hypothetical protein
MNVHEYLRQIVGLLYAGSETTANIITVSLKDIEAPLAHKGSTGDTP